MRSTIYALIAGLGLILAAPSLASASPSDAVGMGTPTKVKKVKKARKAKKVKKVKKAKRTRKVKKARKTKRAQKVKKRG